MRRSTPDSSVQSHGTAELERLSSSCAPCSWKRLQLLQSLPPGCKQVPCCVDPAEGDGAPEGEHAKPSSASPALRPLALVGVAVGAGAHAQAQDKGTAQRTYRYDDWYVRSCAKHILQGTFCCTCFAAPEVFPLPAPHVYCPSLAAFFLLCSRDAELDRGRVKKVKRKDTQSSVFGGGENPFQRLSSTPKKARQG